jgi:hypothetical protein
MPVPLPLPRHIVEQAADRLQIIIPSRKRLPQILLSGIWLLYWACVGFAVLAWLIVGNGGSDEPPLLFIAIALVWWIVCGIFGNFAFLWQLLGRETIDITDYSITIKRTVLGIGSAKEYSAEYIKDLRLMPTELDDLFGWLSWERMWSRWGIETGTIAFDYGAQTFKIGAGLDEAEAKQIILIIQRRYPQYSA